ncbi:MAG: hypothetical protein QM831_36795 [Kofleriaceae bacterium]
MWFLVLLVSWRFHAGDDPRWSQPAFDDNAWELVDLTAPAGANDGDVGFEGFVAGHMDRPGYAWYRATIEGPGRLSAPKLVDDAYDLIVDGKLLVTSGEPGVSLLPKSVAIGQGHHSIAIRVWTHLPSGGGIHVPPAFGTDAEIAADARAHWHLLIWGYIVDLIEPIAFLVLAYVWRRERALAVALVLTALARSHQVVWAWSGAESAATYDLIHALGRPIQLIAWTVAIVRTRVPVWILIPIAIGQIADELSLLGVPGIWFPFGIGVSRTQFAYAAFIALLAWRSRIHLTNS